MCKKFEKIVDDIDESYPYINSQLIREAVITFIDIVNMYRRMLDDVLGDDEDKKLEFLRELKGYLPAIYDKDGRIKINANIFSVKTEADYEFISRILFGPSLAFIQSKIYTPLVTAIRESNIMPRFINESIKRVGSMIYVNENDIRARLPLGGLRLNDKVE